jgi:hypothetical protein
MTSADHVDRAEGKAIRLTKDEALAYFLSDRDDLDEETRAIRDAAYTRLTAQQRERLVRLREEDEQ